MFVRVQVPPAVLFRREDREIEGRWKASFFVLWWCVINYQSVFLLPLQGVYGHPLVFPRAMPWAR